MPVRTRSMIKKSCGTKRDDTDHCRSRASKRHKSTHVPVTNTIRGQTSSQMETIENACIRALIEWGGGSDTNAEMQNNREKMAGMWIKETSTPFTSIDLFQHSKFVDLLCDLEEKKGLTLTHSEICSIFYRVYKPWDSAIERIAHNIQPMVKTFVSIVKKHLGGAFRLVPTKEIVDRRREDFKQKIGSLLCIEALHPLCTDPDFTIKAYLETDKAFRTLISWTLTYLSAPTINGRIVIQGSPVEIWNPSLPEILPLS